MTEHLTNETSTPRTQQEERLNRLEDQVSTLNDALRALVRGLENVPTEGVSREEAASRGARTAHEILLAHRF
jgi:hypothetical protein